MSGNFEDEFRAVVSRGLTVVDIGEKGDPFAKMVFVPRRMFMAFVRCRIGVAGMVAAKVEGPSGVLSLLGEEALKDLRLLWEARAKRMAERTTMSLAEAVGVVAKAYAAACP